jgi:hypothetical protein
MLVLVGSAVSQPTSWIAFTHILEWQTSLAPQSTAATHGTQMPLPLHTPVLHGELALFAVLPHIFTLHVAV